jgi:Zn-dependent M28 family amino/carboxypeptidase
MDDVRSLCAHPHRAVGGSGHAAARDFLARRFAELGLEPYDGDGFALPYVHQRQRFENLVAVVPGRDRTAAPLLLAAHYDTVPSTPGADDNAAAIAIVLEVAARWSAVPGARPLVVASFDAEEPPYFHGPAMGSTHFVGHQQRRDVHAAFVLDLVGHTVPLPGLAELLAIMGSESHPELADAVAARVPESAMALVTLPNRFMPDMSDHHAFRLARRPYLFLTGGHGPDYHRSGDVPERIDVRRLARTVDDVEALARDVAERELGAASEHDTGRRDLAHLRRALGRARADVLGLRAERDLERVVRQMVASLQG